jgi:prolyl-tRNA editing enzyme YbaK/EbsC (Cys-tRNA(Pro) deacylase)
MPPDNPFAPQSSAQSAIRQHAAVARVRETLGKAGLPDSITVMPEATHTAQAAAEALGCNVAEIAKSIIFRARDDRAVLVITSGGNRVDDRKVAALIGQSLGKADAEFVRSQCGFVIGGVAPIAHLTEPIVLMDEDLLQFAFVWPAAGHPNTMFRISPQDLARIASARIADVAQRKNK